MHKIAIIEKIHQDGINLLKNNSAFEYEIIEDSSEENYIHFPITSWKIQPDVKMGYISSVKDARKKLEELYNIKPESKES